MFVNFDTFVTEDSIGTDFAIDVRANKDLDNQDSTTMVIDDRYLVRGGSNCPDGQSPDRNGRCRDVF